MAELLQTERAYVKDLETCITCYLREMRADPAAVPPALAGKVRPDCSVAASLAVLYIHYVLNIATKGHGKESWRKVVLTYIQVPTRSANSMRIYVLLK